MSKEEPGRLLSKMAKFVRNPLKDWAELDAQDSTSGEPGYSREMLREMLERRQRNDFVRRREFDVLRRMRQREAAGIREPESQPSHADSSTHGRSDGRALTLRKIDEIEAQMSRQWWKGDPANPEGTPIHPDVLAAQRSRAYADTTPGLRPDHVRSQDSGRGEMQASRPPEPGSLVLPAGDSALDEAAIRFAHGDDAGAESILLQALVPGSPQAGHDDTWLALLDLYRATGDAENSERPACATCSASGGAGRTGFRFERKLRMRFRPGPSQRRRRPQPIRTWLTGAARRNFAGPIWRS